MQEMLYEINRMINEPVDNEMVNQVKNRMSGSFARALESPQTIARFALNIEKYKLPKDYYETYLEKLSKVSSAEIQLMAKKYLKPENANIIAVGNAGDLLKSMKRFSKDGKVEQRDFYGNEVKQMEISASVSAEDILASYIKAIGGEEKVKTVKDVTTKMSMNMQGMKIDIVSKQKAPNKVIIETLMGGNIVASQIFNGSKGISKSPMGNKEMTPEQVEDMKISSTLNGELYYKNLGIKTEVTGIEDVDGKPAWKLKLTLPNSKTSFEYYDQKSGLKVKTIGQAGQISLTSDYRVVAGILFPFSLKQMLGPQTLEMKVESIEVNKGIEDSVFTF
jgi:hypothetical protein